MRHLFAPCTLAFLILVGIRASFGAEPLRVDLNAWNEQPVPVSEERGMKFFVLNARLNGRPDGDLEKVAISYGARLTELYPKMSPDAAHAISREFITGYQHQFNESGEDKLSLAKNLLALLRAAPRSPTVPILELSQIGLNQFLDYNATLRAEIALSLFQRDMRTQLPRLLGSDPEFQRYQLYFALQRGFEDRRAEAVISLYLRSLAPGLTLRSEVKEWKSHFENESLLWKSLLDRRGGDVTRGELREKLRRVASRDALRVVEQDAVERDRKLVAAMAAMQGAVTEEKARQARLQALRESYALAHGKADFFAALLSQADPRVGRVFGESAKAAIELSELATKVEVGLLSPEVIQTMGLSIVTRLLSLGIGGDSLQQVILEEIRVLRRELAAMGREMRAHFMAVHDHLARMERSLAGELEDIRGMFAPVHQALREAGDGQRMLIAAVQTFTSAERAFRINEQANLCFTLPPGEAPSAETYRSCMTTFHTCALSATDEVSAGLDPGDSALHETSEEDFYLRVSRLRYDLLWKNVLSVSRAAARFGNHLAPDPVANPIPWAACAQLFHSGATRFPKLYAAYDPTGSTLARVLAVGRNTRSALNAVAFAPPAEGKRNQAGNVPFFESLFQGHEGRVTALERALHTAKRQFERKHTAGYDVLLDARQSPTSSFPFLRQDRKTVIPSCAELELPAKTFAKVPKQPGPPPGNGTQSRKLVGKRLEAPPEKDLARFLPVTYWVAHDLRSELFPPGAPGLELCWSTYPERDVGYNLADDLPEFDDKHSTIHLVAYFNKEPVFARYAVFEHDPIPVLGPRGPVPDVEMEAVHRAERAWEKSLRTEFADKSKAGIPSHDVPEDWPVRKNVHLALSSLIAHRTLTESEFLTGEHGRLVEARHRRLYDAVLALFQRSTRQLDAELKRAFAGREAEKFGEIPRQLTGSRLLVESFLSLGFPKSMKTIEGKELSLALRTRLLDETTLAAMATDELPVFENRVADYLKERTAESPRFAPSLLTYEEKGLEALRKRLTRPNRWMERVRGRQKQSWEQLRDFLEKRRLEGRAVEERHAPLDDTIDRLEMLQIRVEAAQRRGLGL